MSSSSSSTPDRRAAMRLTVVGSCVMAVVVLGLLAPVRGITAPPTDTQICVDNLRAIARAGRVYAIDYGGQFPQGESVRYDIFGNGVGECGYAEGQHWESFLQPYVSSCSVFLCPKGAKTTESPIMDNYGWNYDGLSPRYFNGGLAGVKTPSETMMAMDAHNFCFVFGGADTRERFLEQVGVGLTGTASPARHDGAMNVGYVDGHVGSLTAEKLEAAIPQKGIFCPFLGYVME